MARKVNFDYERRQKEMRKQKKRQEKLDAKRLRKESGDVAPTDIVEADDFLDPAAPQDGGSERS